MGKRFFVAVAAGIIAIVLHPGAAEAQVRDEVYLFKIPIKLSQLSPDLSVVRVRCYASAPPSDPVRPTSFQEHIFKISNARLDTTLVDRFQTRISPQDVGKEGSYTCLIDGSLDSNPPQWTRLDASSNLPFRVTPSLYRSDKTFTW